MGVVGGGLLFVIIFLQFWYFTGTIIGAVWCGIIVEMVWNDSAVYSVCI